MSCSRPFDKAQRAPAAPSRRHSTRWNEYSPSHRNREPIAPGSVARCFFDDGELVLGGELAALGFGHHLGAGGGRRGRPRVGSPSAPGGLAPLALPPLRRWQLDHAGISLGLQSASHIDASSSPPPEGR
jgi:hypothetical protein